MDKSNTIKLVAGGMVVAVAGLAGGAMLFPVEHTVTKEVIKEVIVEVPVVSTEVVTETIVKEVKVDNGKLADVLEAIYQADGDLEFVTDDLKESEIAEIADRLVFEMDVQAMAVAAVRAEAIDVLHKESVNGTTLDEDDMERLRIQDVEKLKSSTETLKTAMLKLRSPRSLNRMTLSMQQTSLSSLKKARLMK
jgi:hypothetical protein